MSDRPSRRSLAVAGIVVARQRPKTAKGYTFVLIEDECGPINSIVRPKIYEKHRAVVRMEPFVVVRGRLQKDGDNLNVIAHEVRALRPEGEIGEDGLEMPDAHEWWASSKREESDGRDLDPFDFLTALRQSPPETKSFG